MVGVAGWEGDRGRPYCLFRLTGRGALTLVCFFQSVFYFLSVEDAGGEMVVEKAGSSPSKPVGDRCPQQQQEPLGHVKKSKQQVSDGFTVKAMMKNTVVCLLLV